MKVKTVIDLRVICEPPGHVGQYCQTTERRAKELDRWADDFNSFIKDHRSQDGMHLYVQRETEDQCSHCHCQWETDDDTGEPVCCTAAGQEWAKAKEAAQS